MNSVCQIRTIAWRTLIITALIFLGGCTTSPGDPATYYDRVMDIQQAVFEQEELLIQAVNRTTDQPYSDTASGTEPEQIPYIRIAYIDLCRQIDTSLLALEKLGGFGADTSLQEATRILLNKYKDLSKKEYLAVVTITEIPNNEYLPSDDQHLQALFDEIDVALESEIANFSKACVLFAETHAFKIAEHADQKP
jgi:hypothetical protein